MKEIKLNEETYILKSDIPIVKKECERFSHEIYQKLHKYFGKAGYTTNYNATEEYMLGLKDAFVIDPANVTMTIGKTERAKRFLALYLDLESSTEFKSETIYNFKTENEIKSCYSLELLNPLLKFLKVASEKVVIQMKDNHPIKLETDDFICILAPRILGDDQ